MNENMKAEKQDDQIDKMICDIDNEFDEIDSLLRDVDSLKIMDAADSASG